jgi:2-octaprenyl-6-methoxyphenol hydroxylase
MLKKYDLTIVGGGLVGATLALGLATLAQRQGGYQPSIAVIESQPVQLAPQGKEPPLTADARSTALAYGSRLLLEDLGLWDSLAEQATPIKQIHISRQGHWGASRIDCQTMDRPALGYVIPNQHLKSALWSRLVDHPTIALIAPAEILNLLPVSGGFQLTLAEQPSIQTSLLAIADGSQSASCARLGIKQQRHPYQQQAIIANLSIAKPHENQAFERFLATGPLALLPVQGDRCGLVWTLNDREVGAIAALTDKAFLDHLQRVFGYRLGQLSELSARCQFSLSLVQATEQVRPHLVVLGNAAL